MDVSPRASERTRVARAATRTDSGRLFNPTRTVPQTDLFELTQQSDSTFASRVKR
jgi:hypothetical protein